jgi:mono/diheme cytochrome c family protein
MPAPRLPATAAAVTAMNWDEMQILGATLFAEEIAAVAEGGDRLLHQQLASLGADERRVLREALADPEFA